MIQNHQQIEEKKKNYICDLHFCPNDLIRNGDNLRPKKNVIPFIRY